MISVKQLGLGELIIIFLIYRLFKMFLYNTATLDFRLSVVLYLRELFKVYRQEIYLYLRIVVIP